ncbi:MAG: roadblock/LC7 domain-containing protein [Candidatus Lokiarchaeota archaeon]|nr:roadblock/LC7 domain-containing protein [Candidatus Lokiarchaeota archaeon]
MANNGSVTAAAIMSVQGLPIASQLPRNANEGIVSAISAALLSVAQRGCEELERGTMKRLIVEGTAGVFITQGAGQNSILAILATDEAKMGMLYLDLDKYTKKIAAILG